MTVPSASERAYHARKIGRACALLSLDSFVPFYPYLEVPAPEPDAFQRVIRQAILQNRAAFIANSSDVPDLRATVDHTLASRLNPLAVSRFAYWYDEVFIFGPDSWRKYSAWQGLLLRAKNSAGLWARLVLPDALAEEARRLFAAAINLDEVSQLDEQIKATELSDWDVDMYTRHGLAEEFNDPWVTIDLTFRQLRYRRFMGWLLGYLSREQQRTFHIEATNMAAALKEIPLGQKLPEPLTQPLPDAHDLA